jgi:hypothetical protein
LKHASYAQISSPQNHTVYFSHSHSGETKEPGLSVSKANERMIDTKTETVYYLL